MSAPAAVSRGGRALAAAILAVLLLAGSVGHDPWKPDEAYTFGLVLHVIDTGQWVVPTLAGEPFMEKPPLYFVTAATAARLFSPWLALHDGARLASVFYVGLALLFVALAARRFYGPGHGHIAALLLAGTFNLVPHAHEMITDTALLAGFAVALLGLAYAPGRPRLAGFLLGTGVGVGFMAKGLVQPAMMAAACVGLLAFRRFRVPDYGRCLAWAALFALPWLAVWPALLYGESPELFVRWLMDNNLGRYAGFVRLGTADEPWFYTRTLPWSTFPSGALAVAAAWFAWREGDAARAGLQVCGTVAAGIVLVLATAATVRELYGLPLLLPLAILGSSFVRRVPARVGATVAGTLALFTLGAIGFAWWLWARSMAEGASPSIALVERWLPAGYRFPFEPVAVAVALAITLAWIALWASRRAHWLHLWTASVTALWGVYMVLLLPWIDNAKSFRQPFTDLAEYLDEPRCVASVNLGEPQRAMLDYVARLRTVRDPELADDCRYLLLQSKGHGEMPLHPGEHWALLWEGGRPGERVERFQLWEGPPRVTALVTPATARDRAISSAPATRPAAPR